MSRFEWDERKNEINGRKHKLSFETAMLAFDDPKCLLLGSLEAPGNAPTLTRALTSGERLVCPPGHMNISSGTRS